MEIDMQQMTPLPKISARGVVVRKADIDAYGYDEALRRACIEAGEPVPDELIHQDEQRG